MLYSEDETIATKLSSKKNEDLETRVANLKEHLEQVEAEKQLAIENQRKELEICRKEIESLQQVRRNSEASYGKLSAVAENRKRENASLQTELCAQKERFQRYCEDSESKQREVNKWPEPLGAPMKDQLIDLQESIDLFSQEQAIESTGTRSLNRIFLRMGEAKGRTGSARWRRCSSRRLGPDSKTQDIKRMHFGSCYLLG